MAGPDYTGVDLNRGPGDKRRGVPAARLEPPLFGGRVPTVIRSADWSGVPVAGASRGPLPEQSTAADDAS
jgi:hypothetical protein